MRNLFKTFVLLLLIYLMPVGTVEAAKAPKLNKKSVSLCIGDSVKLQMKNAKKSVTWKSNNKKVVSVTKKGKIKAKKSGSTKIVAKIGKKKYNCKVTVKKQKLNKSSINLLVGENKKLKVSGISKKAGINWVSTDNEVATVYDGEVVAIGEGIATIKAVIPEVFGKTLKCKVTVTENENNNPDVDNSVKDNTSNNNTQNPIDNTNTGNKQEENDDKQNNSSNTNPPHISISGGNNSGTNSSGNGSSTTVVTNTNAISIVEREVIWFGSTKSYDISMSGTNDIGTVTWSSSNEKVLTVDQNGKVYGRCVGTATLKATTSKGLIASINIDIVKAEGELFVDIQEKLDIKEYLGNIDIKNIQWKFENGTIASIDKNGIVTGLKEGTTKIIGTVDNVVCVELTLKFYDNSSSDIYMYIENPGTLMVGTTTILTTSSYGVPSDAVIKWESSNTDVLTISNTGEVKALFPGEATITVYVNDIYMDSITVNVEGHVEAELIYNTQKTVVIGCSNKERATKITIPDGVTTIGVRAFAGMGSLKTVTMPDSVTEIDNSAFDACYSLTDITLSKNIKRLGESAFSGCSIENIELPETLEEIGNDCFMSCTNLVSITIPGKVTNIPQQCFEYCENLENIVLSQNVTRIESWAFRGCRKLKNIDISNVTYICDGAFAGCSSLEKITIPDGITSTVYIDEYGYEQIETNIEGGVFSDCSNLKEATLSKNMEYIPEYLFANCSALTEIVFPENTKKIAGSAFQSCASLQKVTIPATVTSIDDIAFQYCYSLSTVRGKAGSYAEIWAKEKGYTFEAI